MKRISLLAILFILASLNSMQAQSYNEAAASYNEGIGLMKTDPQAAVSAFEKSIQISEQVGDSALDIKMKAANVLADLYFQRAYKTYATDKKPQEALQQSKQTLEVAKKYNVEKTIEKSEKFMVQLYSAIGGGYFKEKAYDKAIAAFDSALMINPENIAAIFNKSLVYKSQDNAELFGKNIDLFIEKANTAGDTAQVSKAKKLAQDYYRASGNKANTANKLNDAVNLLNTSFKYGEDKDVYYALANVLNKQKKFDEALQNAEKGLNMETGVPEAKAKYYYEMAVAQVGKGMNTEACQSFTNAKYGPFLEASKAQMTNLKCK